MEIRVIGIDLAKSVFHLVGMDQHGKIVVRRRLSRSQMMVYTAKIRAGSLFVDPCLPDHSRYRNSYLRLLQHPIICSTGNHLYRIPNPPHLQD
ncbi:MAG: hypothetical protein WA634_00915 [Silvibacterium sp.]